MLSHDELVEALDMQSRVALMGQALNVLGDEDTHALISVIVDDENEVEIRFETDEQITALRDLLRVERDKLVERLARLGVSPS
jgi:hypothetical protein